MEYSYKTLNYSELKRLQYDLTPDNVCPRIFRFFDLPNARGLDDDDVETLVGDISIAESVFLAETEMSVKYRIQEVTELIKEDLSTYLSSADDVFLLFVSPSGKRLTNKEVDAVLDLNDVKNWYCLNYQNYRLEDTTYLYIIAIKEKEDAHDEIADMDVFLDIMNGVHLGKYKDVLRKQAEDYAKSVIVDFENHSDAVASSIVDFLQGASVAIELSQVKSVSLSYRDEFDEDDSEILDDVEIEDLGQHEQALINESLSYAESIIYPNNNTSAIIATVQSFLDGAAAAIKLIKEDSEKE